MRFDPPPYQSQAALRRRMAADRARASRSAAKLRYDVDSSLANALSELVGERGSVGTTFDWRTVLKSSVECLEAKGYDRHAAVELLERRLVPKALGDS